MAVQELQLVHGEICCVTGQRSARTVVGTKPIRSNRLTEDELQETISFQKNVTNISHILFILPTRVTVAIDPPDSLNPQCRTASISISGNVVAGEIEQALLQQVREFIERNREVLTEYRDYKIDTDELRRGLKKVRSNNE
jgi:hypothetical protein